MAGKESQETRAVGRRVVAIGAGKGGVGASMLACNLAVFLAQIGKQVTLIDANLPDAGLHAWLGVRAPERTIMDVFFGRVSGIAEALSPTPITGLSLLAGALDLDGGGSVDAKKRDLVSAEIRSLGTDFVVIDLPSGVNALGLHLFGEADAAIAVTVATPDAVESTYRLFEAAFLHKLRRSPRLSGEIRALAAELATRPGRPPTAREVVRRLASVGPEASAEAERIAAAFHPQLLVNQIRIKADEGLGESMVAAAARWLGIVPTLLGAVEWDENVWLSLRRGKPLLVDFPQSRACRGLERVVRRLLSQDLRELLAPTPIPPPLEEQNLYELLEIYPGASEEEVRRAYKRVREYFGPDGLAVRGACGEAVRAEYLSRAEEAHETLIDKSKRRAYDRATFPNGFPKVRDRSNEDREALTTSVTSPHDSLPRVVLRDDEMVTGKLLGRIRRERGIELEDICNRAKISMVYLTAIEEQRYADLPARVYVRGFVTEYARYLKIDPARAVADFMAAFEAGARKRGK